MNERLEKRTKERISELYNKFRLLSLSQPNPIVARACLKLLANMLVWDCDGDQDELYGSKCCFGSLLDQYQVEELNEYWKQNKENEKS